MRKESPIYNPLGIPRSKSAGNRDDWGAWLDLTMPEGQLLRPLPIEHGDLTSVNRRDIRSWFGCQHREARRTVDRIGSHEPGDAEPIRAGDVKRHLSLRFCFGLDEALNSKKCDAGIRQLLSNFPTGTRNRALVIGAASPPWREAVEQALMFGHEYPMMKHLSARISGVYALDLYLPLAAAARAWRTYSRAQRGINSRHAQVTRLPRIAWSEIFERWPINLVETKKRNGNVHLGELAVLAQAAAATQPGAEIVEIGTFDGRTTINLAINAPDTCPVFTLDLPPDHPTQFTLEAGERAFIDKAVIGARFRSCGPPWAVPAVKIMQLTGDSATFDWAGHEEKAGLVFVDGSHAYEYVCNDSEAAFRLVTAGGTVLWHDYGIWEGVTRALEELDGALSLGLKHISGTSLVCLRRGY